jgi:patatin-like phospholipase/acyl hydrolase
MYAATYLAELERGFAKRVNAAHGLDAGKAFQLVVGTSTGAIIACALAYGTPPDIVAELSRQHSRSIFLRKLPNPANWDLFRQARPSKITTESEAPAI